MHRTPWDGPRGSVEVNGDTEMSKMALLEKASVNLSLAIYNACVVTVPTWVSMPISLHESDNVFCVWL